MGTRGSLGLNLYEGWKLAPRRGQEGLESSSGKCPQYEFLPRLLRGIYRGGMAEQAKTFYSRQETSDSLWQTELQSLSNTKPDLRIQSIEVLTTTPQSVLLKGVSRQRGSGDQKETRVMLPLVIEPSLRTAKGVEIFQPWSAIGNVIFCTRYRIMK